MNRMIASAPVLLAVGLALPLQSGTSRPATSPVAEGWIAAWNSHDPVKWATYFTADIYYEDVTFGEISRGTAEASKFAASFFSHLPDLKLELAHSSVEGTHAT